MGSVSNIGNAPANQLLAARAGQTSGPRPTDGDTPAQEAAESAATKQAEKGNNGYAPHSAGVVNKLV